MRTETQGPVTAVGSCVVVAAPVERAFRVFAEQFGATKPPEHSEGWEAMPVAVHGAQGWPACPRQDADLIASGADASEVRV